MSAKTAIVFVLVSAAAAGPAQATTRHHPHHRHHEVRRSYERESAEGAYTRSDDRIYGGSYYGFFTNPRYGRFQDY